MPAATSYTFVEGCLFGDFVLFCCSQSKFEAPILSLAPIAQVFLCFLNETSKACPCYKSVQKMDKLAGAFCKPFRPKLM